MYLVDFSFQGIRNLEANTLEWGRGVNFITGSNGAGKTSLLEAVYILSLGRSFRSHRLAAVCQTGNKEFLVSGALHVSKDLQHRIGVFWDGIKRSRFNGQWLENHWAIVECFPLIAMHADAQSQLVHSPMERRRFIDWGAFYGPGEFTSVWKQWRRAHEQRNAALRLEENPVSAREDVLNRFESVAADQGEALTALRGQFIERLGQDLRIPLLAPFFESGAMDIRFEFRKGWSSQLGLHEAYRRSRSGDLERGFGQVGPQRADMEIRLNDRMLKDASRGEQKRVVMGIILAQGITLNRQVETAEDSRSVTPAVFSSCAVPMNSDDPFSQTSSRLPQGPVLLLDDPLAELDSSGLKRLLSIVRELKWQCLLTTTNTEWAASFCNPNQGDKMFHVKHGKVFSVD